jgi:hypothetical protein
LAKRARAWPDMPNRIRRASEWVWSATKVRLGLWPGFRGPALAQTQELLCAAPPHADKQS